MADKGVKASWLHEQFCISHKSGSKKQLADPVYLENSIKEGVFQDKEVAETSQKAIIHPSSCYIESLLCFILL